jgi:hypothetical protein
MSKIIVMCTAAAIVACALSLTPAAHPQHETGAAAVTSNVAAKGDRLDIVARRAASLHRALPSFDSASPPDGLPRAPAMFKLRIASAERLTIAE